MEDIDHVNKPLQEPAQFVVGQAAKHLEREMQPIDAEEQPRLPFPVVGIGGNAGGLEAFGEFLKAMPSDSGMAFVFILHLSPDRQSLCRTGSFPAH